MWMCRVLVEGSSSWQARCSRSIQVCFYCCFADASSPLLFYPSLGSVHLLFICSPVSVQYVLYHRCFLPPLQTRRLLPVARSAIVSRLILATHCLPSINPGQALSAAGTYSPKNRENLYKHVVLAARLSDVQKSSPKLASANAQLC